MGNRHQKMVKAYYEAALRAPNNSVTLYALGIALRSAQNMEGAFDVFSRGLQSFLTKRFIFYLKPTSTLPTARKIDPNNSRLFADYIHSLKQLCEWDLLDEVMPEITRRVANRSFSDLHPYTAMLLNLTVSNVTSLAVSLPRHFSRTEMYIPSQHSIAEVVNIQISMKLPTDFLFIFFFVQDE